MAKNIFSMFQGYVPKPKRNVFDLSFNNNFTTKFGQLTPVLCKEVIPGDSFKIETAAGLRLMPMAFPVQTPMKAYVHYFYVRNRALWKDWQDFITGTKSGLVPPYISFSTSAQKEEFFKVGGIADYFGVPNVVYGGSNSDGDGFGQTLNFTMTPNSGVNLANRYPSTGDDYYSINYSPLAVSSVWLNINNLATGEYCYNSNQSYYFYNSSALINSNIENIASGVEQNIRGLVLNNYIRTMPSIANQTQMNSLVSDWLNYNNSYSSSQTAASVRVAPIFQIASLQYEQVYNDYVGTLQINYSSAISSNGTYSHVFVMCVGTDGRVKSFRAVSGLNTINDDSTMTASFPLFNLVPDDVDASTIAEIRLFHIPMIKNVTSDSDSSGTFTYRVGTTSSSSTSAFPTSVSFVISEGSNISSQVIGTGNYSITPFDSDIHLNALPFRAYECIYNSYYRNMQNNPYILDGVEEYNKFIPSNDGGADTNEYKLHQRNWEYDFMTSAVPSPQFGIAPLVGITMTGTATFQDENGTTYYAQAEYDDDGTITGWSTHSSNMPAGTLRMLMDSVGTGISINDLRNVNSFQRFLENSLRVGLKYRDQIKGHFGVDVRYDELEMPEFIGGMSLDINVNQVTQTADVQDSSYPLAGFAGQAGAFGSSKHSVTKYCDEHGFIIGILSVVPVPVYSQLLPKFFTKNEQLDYFFPEFGHIGYQPILQKEVSPLQSYYNGDDLNNVFGYQRAWYDYIASTDEVHSQFRTTLRDFVMNRTFSESPALNEDFLLVDPEQVNDVFLVTSDGEYGPESDKILGQLYFKITKKSPIPMLGIPRLTD